MIKHITLLICCASVLAASAQPLEVTEGKFHRSGKPYCGMGINYFNGFTRLVANPADTTHKQGLATIRTNFGGFYPTDWNLYLSDKPRYFELMDQFVNECGRLGIGIIPSLFWTAFAVPDLMKEPVAAWGDPQSKTIAFMKTYTREVVDRYKDHPALWAWEFGNERMLCADLPEPPFTPMWTQVRLGSPEKRVPEDAPKSSQLQTAYRLFAETVREIDPKRPIITGDAVPRSSSLALRRHATWEPFNTIEDFRQTLIEDNPQPVNTLTLHVYGPGGAKHPGHGMPGQDFASCVKVTMQLAQQTGKPLFIGEFGPDPQSPDFATRRSEVEAMFAEIVAARVPLSAYWNYDIANPNLTDQAPFDVTPDNQNRYILELIRDANQRLNR